MQRYLKYSKVYYIYVNKNKLHWYDLNSIYPQELYTLGPTIKIHDIKFN